MFEFRTHLIQLFLDRLDTCCKLGKSETERRRQLDEDMRQREEMNKMKLKKEWETLENEKRRFNMKSRHHRGRGTTSDDTRLEFLLSENVCFATN